MSSSDRKAAGASYERIIFTRSVSTIIIPGMPGPATGRACIFIVERISSTSVPA